MARTIRGSRVKDALPDEIKDDLSRLEPDPRFLRRIEQARNSLRAGGGIRLENLELK